MHIDFSAVFDRVNHQGIIHNLWSVGIGASVSSISTISIKSSTLWWTVVEVVMQSKKNTLDFFNKKPVKKNTFQKN